jgi:hypothetical protein
MGWSFTYGATRQSIVNDILKGFDPKVKILDHASTCYGKRLWVTIEHDSLAPIVILYLLDKSKGCGWGYKDMDESMGPYYFDCPLRLLKGNGMHNEFSIRWREKVRAYHNQRKEKTV